MSLTLTRITVSSTAGAALAAGALATSGGIAAGQPVTRSTLASPWPTSSGHALYKAVVATEIEPGDLRIWEDAHLSSPLPRLPAMHFR